jgi:hypothetical protein
MKRGDSPVSRPICFNLFGYEKEFRYFYGSISGGVDMHEAEKRAAETPVRYPQAFLPGTSEKPQVSTSIGVP